MSRGIILLAAALLLASSLRPGPVLAQGPPPHRDPRSETGQFDAVAMMGYFGAVMALLAEGDYDDGSHLLDQLAYARIPEDLQFIIQRYAALLGELGSELEAAGSTLDRAKILLDQGDRGAAHQQLESATRSLVQAKRGLEDLQLATDTVARRLGIFSNPSEVRLRKAYEQLQVLLVRLDRLQTQLTATQEELKAAAVAEPAAESVLPPDVDGPQPSGVNGSFGPVTVPPDQEPIPRYRSRLSFDAATRAYPGRLLSLRGTARVVDGPEPPTVFLRVLLEEDMIASFSSGPTFQQEVMVPADVLLGDHLLTLELPPQSVYQGASTSAAVEIVRARPRLELDSPTLNFLPRSIPISGEAASELGPVRNGVVGLGFRGKSSSLLTDDQGRFSGSLPMSLGDLFLGSQKLEVTLGPVEPWHQRVTQQSDLFIINVTNLSILGLVSIYLLVVAGILWRRHRQVRRYDPVGGPGTMPYGGDRTLAPGAPAGASAIPPYPGPDTPRGRIVGAYQQAARFLEDRSWRTQSLEETMAVSFRPCNTLRNFLRNLEFRASPAFVDLTEAAEQALYAVQGPDEEEVQQAERLARTVEQEQG